MGKINKYVAQHLSSSFLNEFNDMDKCSNDLVINVCQNIIEADRVAIEGSSLQTQCGNRESRRAILELLPKPHSTLFPKMDLTSTLYPEIDLTDLTSTLSNRPRRSSRKCF